MKIYILPIVLLVLLAAIWGSSFLFIKIALGSIPPMTIAGGRIVTAALALVIVCLTSGQRLPMRGPHWRYIAAAAVFGNVLPFTLISVGERHIDFSLAAILMATVPLFTIVVANFLTSDERLTRHKVIGILLGFAGIVLLIGPEALLQLGAHATSQFVVVLACLSYAVSGVLSRNLRGLNKLASAAAILTVASLFILPALLIFDRPWSLTLDGEAVGSVLALGLASTAIAQVLILSILQLRDATFLSLNNYLVPAFGIFWGYIFLGERVGHTVWIALALILVGLFVSQGAARRLFNARRRSSGDDLPVPTPTGTCANFCEAAPDTVEKPTLSRA